MGERTRIVLKSGKDQSLRRFHPWVFSGAIKKIQGPEQEGALVDIYDNKEEFLASGHYQKGSIAVRVLGFDRVEADQSFWDQKVAHAWKLREMLGLVGSPETNVFRWINAEGDGLPGLIVDAVRCIPYTIKAKAPCQISPVSTGSQDSSWESRKGARSWNMATASM